MTLFVKNLKSKAIFCLLAILAVTGFGMNQAIGAPKCKYTKYCATNWKCLVGKKWKCSTKSGHSTTQPRNGRNNSGKKTVWGYGAAKVQMDDIPYARKYAKKYALDDARSKCGMRYKDPKRISKWEYGYSVYNYPGRCVEYKGVEICEPDSKTEMAKAEAKFRCR